MTNRLSIVCALLALAPTALAQSNGGVTTGGYRTPYQGTAPNHRFSIAWHGSDTEGKNKYGVYLMAEPAHRKIGPLEEINRIKHFGMNQRYANNAPYVRWSRDAGHVAVGSEVNGRSCVLYLYRIANGRAYPVPLPSRLRAALSSGVDVCFPSNGCLDRLETEVEWDSPTRFVLVGYPNYYGKAYSEDAHRSTFTANVMCELTAGDKCRVVWVRPYIQNE